jgi:prevent-host-death family protein
MPPTTINSRRFNQDASGAKRAAKEGPVFITDRGRPAHVLLSIEDYRALTGEAADASPSILDLLADPAAEDVPFEPPRSELTTRPADLG